MNMSLLFSALLVLKAEPWPLEMQEQAIADAEVPAQQCTDSRDFEALFLLAASRRITGAHTSEELSEVNEMAFLKCPLVFLRALNVYPEATQDSVLDYFGIRHAPWELGKELRNFENHQEVGKLVRTQFVEFLKAEEPK